MRLLHWLRHDVPRRYGEKLTFVPRERGVSHGTDRYSRRLAHHLLFAPGIDPESAEFGFRRRLTDTKLDTSSGKYVQGAHALRHPDRVIDSWRQLCNPVPDPDPLGSLGQCRHHHLRTGQVAFLLLQFMFGAPHRVIAELVTQLE